MLGGNLNFLQKCFTTLTRGEDKIWTSSKGSPYNIDNRSNYELDFCYDQLALKLL